MLSEFCTVADMPGVWRIVNVNGETGMVTIRAYGFEAITYSNDRIQGLTTVVPIEDIRNGARH